MAALDCPRRGPSRPRIDGKGQNRLRVWHGKVSHDSTQFSNGSGLLYYTIRSDGDGSSPREPSEVDDGDGPVIINQILLINADFKLSLGYRDLLT